jgi:hypothetical protein
MQRFITVLDYLMAKHPNGHFGLAHEEAITFGAEWPPKHGWIHRLAPVEVTEHHRRVLLAYYLPKSKRGDQIALRVVAFLA